MAGYAGDDRRVAWMEGNHVSEIATRLPSFRETVPK